MVFIGSLVAMIGVIVALCIGELSSEVALPVIVALATLLAPSPIVGYYKSNGGAGTTGTQG